MLSMAIHGKRKLLISASEWEMASSLPAVTFRCQEFIGLTACYIPHMLADLSQVEAVIMTATGGFVLGVIFKGFL
jgi:hypothetical protein